MYHMEIETYILDADREELEVVIEVTKYNYDGGYAGYTYGPPEQCYQGEGAPAELEEYVIRDAKTKKVIEMELQDEDRTSIEERICEIEAESYSDDWEDRR